MTNLTKNSLVFIFYFIVLGLFVIYSYALVDPNLTLVSNSAWIQFREAAVQLGYYQRTLSWYLYLSFVLLLGVFYFYFQKNSKNIDPFKLSLGIAVMLLFSYPFLSHDFFNYIFDAKILTFYGQNPYTHKPSDFGADEWLRFMHWTHRTYPYGPVFLLSTLVPSFASFGKFIFNFIFFKALFVIFYLLGVFILQKKDRQTALTYATHPFVIIEGLINTHNDLLAVSLALIGIYYLQKESKVFSTVFFILSAGIKFTTFPLITLQKNARHPFNYGALIMQTAIFGYLTLYREIQPWYFLTFFAFLPLSPKIIRFMNIFLFGLLMSYFPLSDLVSGTKIA